MAKTNKILSDEEYREIYRKFKEEGLSPQDALTETLRFFLVVEAKQ